MTYEEKEHLIRMLGRYRGLVFRWQRYQQPSPEWDHDHCVGCWVRFAENSEKWQDSVHTEGWATVLPSRSDNDEEPILISNARAAGHSVIAQPHKNGFRVEWVCPECFESCREELGFRVDAEHPQWKKAGF